MKLKTELLVEVPKEREFFFFSVEATGTGTKIRAKSPIFAAWLNTLDFRTITGPWAGLGVSQIYLLKNDYIYPHEKVGFWTHQMGDPQPNLVWLGHPNLKDGFEIVYPEPMAANDLEEYFQVTCSLLRELYLNYINSPRFSATLSEVLE